jgi:hypothetical protein
MTISRRVLLQSIGVFAASSLVRRPPLRADDADLAWHDVTHWGVEGRGWEDLQRKRYFDRLPAKSEGTVRNAVWSLSRHSAGMAVRLQTDASEIWVDYELLSDRLAMPHMPATGVSGLDLYGQLPDGQSRWVQVIKPTSQQIRTAIASGLEGGLRVYTIYLPLYNGVESLRIGVSKSSQFAPLAPRTAKPIVFYGTSIMHGACASRPGMAIPAILGRRFNRPTINLGFSGNGRMDAEVAELLAELDAAVFCIDCLPNMNADLVTERTAPLVRTLRERHSETPILLVEDRVFTNAAFFPARRKVHQSNHRALRAAFDGLQASGCPNLYYLPGDDLLGSDGEAATDGSHPSDLGFFRYAAAYEKVLAPLFPPASG